MQEKREEHFVGLVAQKAVIEKEGKVLFVRNLNDPRWDFPGGRLHIDELPEDGLQRELHEEIGCTCEIGNVVYVNQYFHSAAGKSCLFINYWVQLPTDATIQIAPDELSEYAWLDPANLSQEETFQNCIDTLRVSTGK